MSELNKAFYDLIYNNVLFKQVLLALHLPRIPVLQSAVSPKLVHSITPFISFIILTSLVAGLLFLIRLLYQISKSLGEASTLLEITPPVFTEKSAYTTSQLFSVIHNLGSKRSVKDKLLGKKITFSFEIVSTLDWGIRYLIRASPDQVSNLKRHLYSYLPQSGIKEVADYLPKSKELIDKHPKIFEFKLSKHFAFPLQRQNILDEHDPVAYITGMMTKLLPGELISFQIVLAPKRVKEVNEISRMVLRNEDVLGYLTKPDNPIVFKPILFVLRLTIKLIMKSAEELQWVISEITHPSSTSMLLATQQAQSLKRMQMSMVKPARVISSFEQQHIQSVQEKINQSLFETSIRVMTVMNDEKSLQNRADGIMSSLAVYSVPQYQSFVVRPNLSFGLLNKINWITFMQRLLSLVFNSSSSLLSVSEMADLYHFPYTYTTKTEGLVKVHSPELPAPLSLKRETTQLDVMVGKNIYGGQETLVGLTKVQRHEHTYIVGKTGMGKTTIIKQMAYQDILAGKGIAVIDPHGDLVKELLRLIPEKRKKDVIYLDPTDKLWPVGLNILNPGGSFVDEEERVEWITGAVISVFIKITPKANWGQRMEHILRNATLTALTTESPTLMTIQKLLTNKAYRQSVTATLKDLVLKQFWVDEFKQYGNMQIADIISPLTNRLGEFITSPMSRHILLQAESTIKLADIMDQGKILLVNLSKGNLGEERSSFFGTLIISLIQLAAYQRAQIPESKRKDFFLYIDEFQNFATSHFADIFSEARKFHVYIIPSHQNVAQIEDVKTAKVVLGNSGTIISLKNGPDDEAVILPFMAPEVEKGNIINLPPHHFFMKVTNADSEEAFSGVTIPLEVEGSDSIRDFIIANTRQNYATPRAVAEKQLDTLFGGIEKPADQGRKQVIKENKETVNETKNTNRVAGNNTGDENLKKSERNAHKRGLK